MVLYLYRSEASYNIKLIKAHLLPQCGSNGTVIENTVVYNGTSSSAQSQVLKKHNNIASYWQEEW